LNKKETFMSLSQIPHAIAFKKYDDERYLFLAKYLWGLRFKNQNRLAPLLNGIECDRAYLADLLFETEQEIQIAIDCLKEDDLIIFYDPFTHLPTVVEEMAFVSEERILSLITEHHERHRERIKAKILEQQQLRIKLAGGQNNSSLEAIRATNTDELWLNDDVDIDWPKCFPNVGHASLEKTFGGKKWRSYTQRGKRNGLIKARPAERESGKYNLYLAALWWLAYTKPQEFDLARVRRKLADNLLPEYMHLRKRLTGESDLS